MSKYSIYRQCVAGKGWEGVLSCVRDQSALCFWPESEPTKLLDHFKQKSRRGGGIRQINTCRKVPLQVNFFSWRHFALLSISLIFLLLYGMLQKRTCLSWSRIARTFETELSTRPFTLRLFMRILAATIPAIFDTYSIEPNQTKAINFNNNDQHDLTLFWHLRFSQKFLWKLIIKNVYSQTLVVRTCIIFLFHYKFLSGNNQAIIEKMSNLSIILKSIWHLLLIKHMLCA